MSALSGEGKKPSIYSNVVKELICTKNHRLLREYGITKGQIVQVRNESIYSVEYYDKDMKQTRIIKLSRKLMKHFKELSK